MVMKMHMKSTYLNRCNYFLKNPYSFCSVFRKKKKIWCCRVISPTTPGQMPAENHWQSTHLALLWEAMTEGREDMAGVLCWMAREEGSHDSSSTKDKWQEGNQRGFGSGGKGIYYYKFSEVSLSYKTLGTTNLQFMVLQVIETVSSSWKS